MKTTLVSIVILFVLYGCKDETVNPAPVTPAHMSNYFVLAGTEVPLNNDDSAWYWVSEDYTTLYSNNGTRWMCLAFPGNDTGMYHMVGQSNYPIGVYLNEGYSRPDIWIHVTRYDPVGGRVQGTFTGTFKQNSDTTVVLNANGGFDLTRIPDL